MEQLSLENILTTFIADNKTIIEELKNNLNEDLIEEEVEGIKCEIYERTEMVENANIIGRELSEGVYMNEIDDKLVYQIQFAQLICEAKEKLNSNDYIDLINSINEALKDEKK